jgi:hypothetical protein
LKYKFNTAPYIGTAILLAILLLFKNPIDKLLDVIIVKPLFASFEASILIDSVVVLCLAFLVAWTIRGRAWKSVLRFVLFALAFYGFERLNAHWNFTPMESMPDLAYWDLVAIALVLSLPLCFLSAPRLTVSDAKSSRNGFVEDNTVTEYEDDHFKRKVAAEEIARLILHTPNKKSFAIGILGQYGSGKTSFLNLINLALGEENVLKVSFDPWSAANPEMIRREFFDLLADKVAGVDMKMSSLIYSYGRKLASFDGRSQSLFNWLGFFRSNGSVQSSGEYQQINNMLGATGHKLIVSIDDLDRLYPAEIIEVLKLIRNTAGFSNVVYLVGYDKEYIQSAIGTLNGAAADFLDKIFQLEIPLPKREQDDLLFSLKSNLKVLVSEAHYAVFENTMIPNGFRSRYEKAYSGILRQGRDVVRFLNTFKIAYNLIGEEVDFECLLLLELIKFRFPVIYDLIYTQRDTFLNETPLRATHEQYFSPHIFKPRDFKNHTVEISVFKTHLEKLGLDSEDVSLLDGLFMTLFKGSQYHRPDSKNSISYPLYFEIYFRYRLSQTDLSDKDYQAAKAAGKMSEYMVYCATQGLHKELMTRLMQEDITKDQHHFEEVIRWIFSFGRTVVEKDGMFHFDYESLVDKIYNYHTLITNKLYPKNARAYKDFINHLFSISMAPFLFDNQLIYHLKEKDDEFVVPPSELTAHQYSYFTRMATSGHGLSKDTLRLFWGARERVSVDDTGAYTKHWRFEPELASIMKVYLARIDPTEFLKFSILRDMPNRSLTFIHQQVLDMFNNKNDYRKLVAENPALDEVVRTEYLELFDKMAEADFKQYVEMEFKSVLYKPETS